MDVTREQFEEHVRRALDAVPEPFSAELARVAVNVHEQPPPGAGRLYGRYTGVPLDERGGEPPLLPSVIEIYMHPMVHDCRDEDELRHEIRITVLHELGHHFGFDEDDLARLGYA